MWPSLLWIEWQTLVRNIQFFFNNQIIIEYDLILRYFVIATGCSEEDVQQGAVHLVEGFEVQRLVWGHGGCFVFEG